MQLSQFHAGLCCINLQAAGSFNPLPLILSMQAQHPSREVALSLEVNISIVLELMFKIFLYQCGKYLHSKMEGTLVLSSIVKPVCDGHPRAGKKKQLAVIGR